MSRVPTAQETDERDLRAALDWFLDVAPDRGELERRIGRAQEHYRAACRPSGPSGHISVDGPDTSQLLLADDRIASALAQGASWLGDRRSYDALLGAQFVPFLASIGRQAELLRRRPGATARVQRMLHPTVEHPGDGLLVLAAAARYAREDFEVSFNSESNRTTGDLVIRIAEIPRAMEVACCTLRPDGDQRHESLGPGAQRISTELARLDRQLSRADLGIVHIGIEAESDASDAVTADQRRRENLAAIRAFNPRSRIAELHLHYFEGAGGQGAGGQGAGGEAVDRHSRWHGFLLEDPRLLEPVADLQRAGGVDGTGGTGGTGASNSR
jgi:hypothetical protein